MKRKLLATGFVMIGTLLSACAANGALYVRFAPSPRYGVLGVAPGRWMRPPHARAMWVPGVWVQSNRGYAFRRGHWR